MPSDKSKSAGFTILEVLITLGILSIVLVSATKLLTSNVKAVQETSKGVDYTQNLRIASNQIMDQIRKNNSVKVSYDGSGVLLVDNNPLLDSNKKISNTNNSRLWLYNSGGLYSELRLRDELGSNKVIAEYIEYIQIKDQLPNGNLYLNIIIKVADTEETILSIPKTYAFSSVLPPPTPPNPNSVWGDFVTFSHRLDIQDAQIIGSSAIVYVANRQAANFSVSNSNTKIQTSKIYIEKNLQLRDAWIGKDDGSSNVYVDGNINFHNQARVLGTLYYTGSFSQPAANAIKVDTIDFPAVSMPTPQSDSWYIARGFTNNSSPRDNMKYKGNSITIRDTRVNNVCIYSTGDITINNSNTYVSGILYAPEGHVEIWDATFEGLIIADRITLRNSNCRVIFRPINITDLPF